MKTKQKKIKQVSYLLAILIVTSSTIGAGIFFKNSQLFKNSQGHLGFVFASWGVAFIGIMAMALVLIKMARKDDDDKGIYNWTKNYTNRWFHKSAVGNWAFIYIPIIFVSLPAYALMSLEDAFGWKLNPWILVFVGLLIVSWTIFMSGLSLKAGTNMQTFLGFAKFLPIILVPVFAFMNVGDYDILNKEVDAVKGLDGASPWIGLFASMGAILFAFDGFYAVTNIRNEMKEPRKMGSAVAIGLSIITVVYIFLSISFAVGSKKGDIFGIKGLTGEVAGEVVNTLIFVAVLGIINGFSLSMPRSMIALWNEKSTWKPKFLNRFNDATASTLYVWIITVIFSLVFAVLGIYLFNDSYSGDYGALAGSWFTLMDLVTNWTSVIIFFSICTAIVGFNRKTPKIWSKDPKTLVFSILACLYVFSATTYMLISVIVNLTGYNGADFSTSITSMGILLLIIAASVLPATIDYIKNRKQKSVQINS